MIKEGHNNRQINLKVLETLKIVCTTEAKSHGDLKETCSLKNDKSQTNFGYTISLAGEHSGRLRV